MWGRGRESKTRKGGSRKMVKEKDENGFSCLQLFVMSVSEYP